MQEEVEMRTVTLAVNGSKLTARMLKNAIAKLLTHMRNKQRNTGVTHRGKQTVKQLVGQNQGVSNIEITDTGVKDFERIARKYGVDFAVKKIKGDKPKYLIFFKARDADALTAAFSDYTDKRVQRSERPSVIKTLNSLKAAVSGHELKKDRQRELSL